jgi:hypothetical protein
MQEDENPYEQEKHLPYENRAEGSQPEPEPQPTSESVAGESQPEQEPQPPPAAPVRLPLTSQQKRRQYFLSLGFGFIPVIVLLVTVGIGVQQGESGLGTLIFGALLAVLLYIVELITTIVFLVNERRRFAGYGLLTAFLVTPVVAAIGCTIIPNLIHP